MNPYAVQHGKATVGVLNPTLYGLLSGNKSLTHDVVRGDNKTFPAVRTTIW